MLRLLRTLVDYALAIAIVLAIVAVKLLVPGLGTPAPFLLVSLTVGIAAWLTGRGPGLVAAIVAAFAVDILLVDRNSADGTSGVVVLVAGLADFTFMALVASEVRSALVRTAAARRAAEDATRARDAFVSAVAHELRTPLTSVLGYAQLLERRLGSNGHGRGELDAIVHETRRASRLIDDLTQTSRLDVQALPLETDAIDLTDVARGAMTSVAPRLRSQDRVDLALAKTAPVVGDAMRLEQILVNLVDNALKYSPDGAAVELSVDVEGQEVVARVNDRGIGIGAEEAAKLFEPFYRAKPRLAAGLGLGLYVSHAIARRHGGSLAYEPRAGGGSTFVLRLPLRHSAPDDVPFRAGLDGRALQAVDELAGERE